MKKLYFLAVVLFFGSISNAQIINIPDPGFKALLLSATPSYGIVLDSSGNPIQIDTNGNGEIEVAEALVPYSITFPGDSYTEDLTGIEYFTNLRSLTCSWSAVQQLNISTLVNLEYLDCRYNALTSLDVSALSNLQTLICDHNQMTTLDVSGLTNLVELDCNSNWLTNINVSGATNLTTLRSEFTQLTTFDGSDLHNLEWLYLQGNQLQSVFLKNGAPLMNVDLNNNYNTLEYICVDESRVNYFHSVYPDNIVINSYCTFTPGGEVYYFSGSSKLDSAANGCDDSDYAVPGMKFSVTNGAVAGIIVPNLQGDFIFASDAGSHTITPIWENPDYFTVSPSSVTVDFPSSGSPFTQNFCVTPNGTYPDLEISLLPIGPARPGFDCAYQVVFKNKGTITQSGTISITFDDLIFDFVSSLSDPPSIIGNTLTWDFINLNPFESRFQNFVLNLNSPIETPAVNGGDEVVLNAAISGDLPDTTPSDNVFGLNQIVVNSHDPNDIRCLEGNVVSTSQVGQYVHYIIRFENVGTYPAENIVVKDLIQSSRFDINSVVPISASHQFFMRTVAGNMVEFIFEDINLPFDDANNDGFIAFKVKLKPNLVAGNVFTNVAAIYFDYNFPIITNEESTLISTLNSSDFSFERYFEISPNPASSELRLATKNILDLKSISIFNMLGQQVIVIPNAKNINSIDVSTLQSGTYFIRIDSDKGTSATKFIKN